MAVVKMTKIKLIGLSKEREKILNALHKTGCVQLKETALIEDTKVVSDVSAKEVLSDRYARLKSGVEFLTERIENAKDKDLGVSVKEKELFVSYGEFTSIGDFESEAEEVLISLETSKNALNQLKAERAKAVTLKGQLAPFERLNYAFSDFADTDKTSVFMGLIKPDKTKKALEDISNNELASAKVLATGSFDIIFAVCYRSETDKVLQILSENGFNKCPFNYDVTAKEKMAEIDSQIVEIDKKEIEINDSVLDNAKCLNKLKILCDSYKFRLEKETSAEKFRFTDSTFILEGYLPEEKINDVKSGLDSVTDSIITEFSQPTKDDNPPTLLKNNKVVKQSEFIIDLYSTPDYRESDPTKITFFFFMLFMGVIMADVGYGVLMIALGLTLARRIKVDNGARRLWNVVAIGGISTIIFGLLFNSFFGFALPFYTAPLPSPVPTANGGDDALNSLMTVLLLCLGLGVLQIAFGYLWKAINCFKNKDILGAIFDGITWVLFFIGFIFASFNFLIGYLLKGDNVLNPSVKAFFDTMTVPGLIIVGVALLIAMVTAGRNEKGFGHFTKGFGAVYGIINIMSDILSYARLFGLMLSGMIIAQTFNDMGLSIMNGGGVGYVLGPLVFVIGHVFNFAMGVLGAYIHDSRLQYIEFFGKFYTGEGEKFTPIGSKLDYVYLTK